VLIIVGSVGQGGKNNPGDVRLIQRLLNDVAGRGGELLKVDGMAGPKTIAAITRFQEKVTGQADGRIDPGRTTIRKLAEAHFDHVAQGLTLDGRDMSKQSASLLGFPMLIKSYWDELRKS